MTDVQDVPATAGALLIDGRIHTHASIRGDVPPDLHPLIHRFLDELPVEQRERYLGWCAEPVLLSDRLWAAGASLTVPQARQALWGARLVVTRVRETSDPTHGAVQPPCRSCAPLLDLFGVEVIADGPTATEPTEPATTEPATTGRDDERARRWALALGSRPAPDGRTHPVVAPALDVLARYGGLTVAPGDAGEQVAPAGFRLDPLRVVASVASLSPLAALLDTRLTPIGEEWGGVGILAIDAVSRVFVVDHTAAWFLGEGIDAALDTLVRGRRPARVGSNGSW